MSTEGSNFDAVLFVQLCGGEPALYDPSCHQGNIEAACFRISRTLVKRGTDSRLPPRSVKPLFDRVRAIYEEEAKNRTQGGYQELNWYHPMDAYMRRFLSWTQGPSTSENVSDPESTNNTFNGNKPETETQEVSHSVPKSNLEKTPKENGSNQALEREIKLTNEIPNRIDIGRISIANTARKSFNTPTKNSPPNPTIVGKNNESFISLEMDASSSTLGCNSNPEAVKSVSVQNELPAEDDPCDVCRSVLPEDGNEMPYCDSCNVCVHQACYGVAKVPDGPWFCSPCSMKIKPLCALCPKPGGAMKRTSDERQWAHVSCAWWIRDVKFDIPEKMEAINISNISADRWKLVCSVCKMKHGVCTQCMVPRCTVAYHVTCAFDKGQTMEIRDAQENKDGVKLLTYCKRHSRIGTLNSQKKKTQKRKYRRSSTDVKRTTPRKISLLSNEDNINEAIASLVHRNRLSESDSTSDSSLGSGTVSSSSSEADERRSSKRVKRSESGGKQLPATSAPYKNQSNAEREPIVPSQNKPLSPDKVLYSFHLSTSSDAHQKPNFEYQNCGVQLNKPLESQSLNKKHVKAEPSSNSSSPQGKQKTLYELSGFVLSKNDTTTPRKSTPFPCATPTAQMDNSKTKSSTTNKKQTSTESRQPPTDNSHRTVGNSSSSKFEEGSPFGRRLTFEHQNKNRPFAPEEPVPEHQNHLPSTSTAIHCPTDQSSSSSLDHEQTDEANTTPWSKTASIKQLAKTVAIEMQNLSDREAKKLERRIVWLCIKSRRKSENLKK